MNPRISEKINYLSEFICNEIDEDSLVSNGRRLIEELRDEWKLNRLDFSDENVKSLRRITLLLDEIEDFIFEQQDFQYISSKEEIDEATGRLQYILTNTSNLKIAARINKEVRELLERRTSLPNRGATKKDEKLRRALSTLRSKIHKCNKCDKNPIMVLREGPSSFFWGCPTFPVCWGRKFLTKEELSVLPD